MEFTITRASDYARVDDYKKVFNSIFELEEWVNSLKEKNNHPFTWKPPYPIIIDFEDKEIIIYDSWIE